jgi:hypothetical protein
MTEVTAVVSESNISHEEASRVIKRAAANQKIELVLTEDQMSQLLQQWNGDPSMPAQINFIVGNKPLIQLPVASCAYFGDTCCAFPLPFTDTGDPPPDEIVIAVEE